MRLSSLASFFVIALSSTQIHARPDPQPTPTPHLVFADTMFVHGEGPFGVLYTPTSIYAPYDQKWNVQSSDTGCVLYGEPSLGNHPQVSSRRGSWAIYMPRGASIDTLFRWIRVAQWNWLPGTHRTHRVDSYLHNVAAISASRGCVVRTWSDVNWNGAARAWHGGSSGYTEVLADRAIASARCDCSTDPDPSPILFPVPLW
jgi:hypothetical protein